MQDRTPQAIPGRQRQRVSHRHPPRRQQTLVMQANRVGPPMAIAGVTVALIQDNSPQANQGTQPP